MVMNVRHFPCGVASVIGRTVRCCHDTGGSILFVTCQSIAGIARIFSVHPLQHIPLSSQQATYYSIALEDQRKPDFNFSVCPFDTQCLDRPSPLDNEAINTHTHKRFQYKNKSSSRPYSNQSLAHFHLPTALPKLTQKLTR